MNKIDMKCLWWLVACYFGALVIFGYIIRPRLLTQDIWRQVLGMCLGRGQINYNCRTIWPLEGGKFYEFHFWNTCTSSNYHLVVSLEVTSTGQHFWYTRFVNCSSPTKKERKARTHGWNMAGKSSLVHYCIRSARNVCSRFTSLSASVQANAKLGTVGVVLLRVVGRLMLHNILPWRNQFDLQNWNCKWFLLSYN